MLSWVVIEILVTFIPFSVESVTTVLIFDVFIPWAVVEGLVTVVLGMVEVVLPVTS